MRLRWRGKRLPPGSRLLCGIVGYQPTVAKRALSCLERIPIFRDSLAVQAIQSETEQFLFDLIRLPCLPGEELDALECAAQRFAEVGEVERVLLTDALREDEDYADPVPGLVYEGRANLRVRGPEAVAGGRCSSIPVSMS